MDKIKLYIISHKLISALIVIVIIGGGYYWYSSTQDKKITTQYVTGTVEKGTLAVSVSGTGQVAATNSLDIKPQTTGTVQSVVVKVGQEVKEGDVLLTIDSADARIKLGQAKSSLAQAQSSYDKLVGVAAANEIKSARLSVTQAETALSDTKRDYANTITNLNNSVTQAEKTIEQLKDSDPNNSTYEQAIQSAQEDLDETKISSQSTIDSKNVDLFSATKNKVISLTTALDAINRILEDSDIRPTLGVQNSAALSQARSNYELSKSLLGTAKSAVQLADTNRTSANTAAAYDAVYRAVTVGVDAASSMFATLQATIPSSDISQSAIDSYKSSISGHNSTLATALTSLESSKQGVADAESSATTNIRKAEQTLKQANLNYQNALETADETLVTVKSTKVTQEISAQTKLNNAQNSLASAKLQLETTLSGMKGADVRAAQAQVETATAQYQLAQKEFEGSSLKAPFDGQVATINVKKGDEAGADVAVTLITKQRLASLSLNETDIAKVSVGQKATLTFDAVEDLPLTGTVVQVDLVGTLTQNVVSYTVQILFDTNDERVKPGMSVSASIITDIKQDVLLVPSAAVKNEGTQSYVEILMNGAPQQKIITAGLSNDSQTEVSGDIKEGDEIITQTIITNPTATTTQPTGSLLQGLGGGGGQRTFGNGGGGAPPSLGAPIGR